LSSKILVDELAGKTAAGNITVTSEGGSATMQLQQGIGKVWLCLNAEASTPAARDSFNISSITDVTLAHYRPNYSSSMNSTDYSATGGASWASPDGNYGSVVSFRAGSLFTSSSLDMRVFRTDNYTEVEAMEAMITIHGDLA